MNDIKVGDIIYYRHAKRHGVPMKVEDIPLLKVTDIDRLNGKLNAVVVDIKESEDSWVGKAVKGRKIRDYALHTPEKKANDLSDLDSNFSLSVLKNVLLNTCLEMADVAQSDGFESDEFRLKLAQVKSLGESIKKLEY